MTGSPKAGLRLLFGYSQCPSERVQLLEFDGAEIHPPPVFAAPDQCGKHQLQAGLLGEEPRDYLGPPPAFLKRPLQEIRRADQLPESHRQPQVVQRRFGIVGKTGHCTRVEPFVLGNHFPHPRPSLLDRRRIPDSIDFRLHLRHDLTG